MAATNYILVNGGKTRLNRETRALIDFLQQANDVGNALNNSLTEANSDGAAALATALGLSEDDAAAVRTLVSAVMSDLNGSSAIDDLLSRLG